MRAFAAVLIAVSMIGLSACGSLGRSMSESADFVDFMFNLHLDERDYDMDFPTEFRATSLTRP